MKSNESLKERTAEKREKRTWKRAVASMYLGTALGFGAGAYELHKDIVFTLAKPPPIVREYYTARQELANLEHEKSRLVRTVESEDLSQFQLKENYLEHVTEMYDFLIQEKKERASELENRDEVTSYEENQKKGNSVVFQLKAMGKFMGLPFLGAFPGYFWAGYLEKKNRKSIQKAEEGRKTNE